MDNKKTIRLAVPIIAIIVIIVVGIILIQLGVIKTPFSSIPLLQKKATVQLKTSYGNPFKKETQYVNPFDKYKNPFVVNK